jgi:hypothetical protein
MAFAQLTFRESLRDIECCLRALEEKLLQYPRIETEIILDSNEQAYKISFVFDVSNFQSHLANQNSMMHQHQQNPY